MDRHVQCTNTNCWIHPDWHAKSQNWFFSHATRRTGRVYSGATWSNEALSKPQEGEFDVATARSLFHVLSADQCSTAEKTNIGAGFAKKHCLLVALSLIILAYLLNLPLKWIKFFLNLFNNGQAYTWSRVSSLANRSWICWLLNWTTAIRRQIHNSQ